MKNGLFSTGVASVPNKDACLPVSSCLLVSVWCVFGDFFCSVPRVHAEPRRLGHHPKNWLFRDSPVKSLRVGDMVAPALAQLGFTPGSVSHEKSTRTTASRSSRSRLSSPEGSVFLALLCYFAVGFITLSALVLVKYIIEFLGLLGGFCGSSWSTSSSSLGHSAGSVATRIPKPRGLLTLSTTKGPLAASGSRGDGHGVRRTSTLARLHDVQRLSRMMVPAGVGRDTGAAYARRHLFQWRNG